MTTLPVQNDDRIHSLREQAEHRLGRLPDGESVSEYSVEEFCALIHELRVHRLELELQNEELRQAQQELELARDRFRDLYDFAPVGYLTIARDGRILDANLTAAHLLGLPRPALTASRLYRFVAKEDEGTFFAHWRGVFDNGEAHSCEIRLTGEGAPFEARLESLPQADQAGELSSCRVAISDITAHKEANRSWRLADAVLEAAAEGVILCNAERQVIRVNRAFTEITGFQQEQIRGRVLHRLTAAVRGSEILDAVWSHLERADRWSGELWCRRASGGSFPARVSLTTIRNEAGALTHVAGMLVDATELKRSEEQMRYRACFDGITGLPNRMLFADRLAALAKEAYRHGNLLGLLFLDLDRFKQINDQQGHAMGDALLREVASRLSASVREHDTVARVGGDEFAVILPDVGQAHDITTVAEKINAALSIPVYLEGVEILCGVSIGIAVYPTDTEDLDALRRYADMAMYRAKAAGPNTYRFFDPGMTEQAVVQQHSERALSRALRNQEFRLWYQPIVRSGSAAIVGAEALLRWQHPERGLLGPDFFLQLAEETGQIQPLGEWIIREACRQAGGWEAVTRTGPPFLSLNVSVRQLYYPTALVRTLGVLREAGLALDRVVIELTEGITVGGGDSGGECLQALKQLGVRLALDDFGTGYSSLGRLRRLPLDILKIDRSFIQDVETDATAAHLVESIIHMAHGLGLEVIGEGVETRGQLEYLRRLQCDYVQGNFLSPPVDVVGLHNLLAMGLPSIPS